MGKDIDNLLQNFGVECNCWLVFQFQITRKRTIAESFEVLSHKIDIDALFICNVMFKGAFKNGSLDFCRINNLLSWVFSKFHETLNIVDQFIDISNGIVSIFRSNSGSLLEKDLLFFIQENLDTILKNHQKLQKVVKIKSLTSVY